MKNTFKNNRNHTPKHTPIHDNIYTPCMPFLKFYLIVTVLKVYKLIKKKHTIIILSSPTKTGKRKKLKLGSSRLTDPEYKAADCCFQGEPRLTFWA